MGHKEHEAEAPAALNIGVLTLSDTRSKEEDLSGKLICEMLQGAGHKVSRYDLIREDPKVIEETLKSFLKESLDIVITNGGTGLTSRDGTIEVAHRLMQKELPGFGELFRLLSFHQIGPAAMLSRATAGSAGGKIILCLPGSTKAVKLAMTRIIIPQAGHLVREARR